MKNMKRLLTLCTVVMLVATMLVLSSCGLFASDVEKAINKLSDAESYTRESDNYIYKVDVENRMVYIKYTPDEDSVGDKTRERWIWADAENGKYYEATKVENTIEKEELTKGEFLMTMAEYADTASFQVYLKFIDLLDENDGVYSYEIEYDSYKVKYSLSVADDVLTSKQQRIRDGETDVYETKYSAVNDTVVEIPADVISAEVAAE